ncbi:hypothetical protein NXF25_015094, partial [Crotalus adamanteus]
MNAKGSDLHVCQRLTTGMNFGEMTVFQAKSDDLLSA